MILIGIGSNLSSERHGRPQDICAAALEEIGRRGARVAGRSRWFRTAPVPASDQPWFVNAVAALDTSLPPAALLSMLHAVEAEFGRTRRLRNEARVIDLDLLAYHDLVSSDETGPVLPHPRMHERAFVLLPLADVAPGWRHPATGAGIGELIGRLPPDQVAEPVDGD